MGISRNLLLWASKNPWLINHVPNYNFVKTAVKKFMPGEELDDAISSSINFQKNNIITVLTHLGENLTDLSEAKKVKEHYISVIDKIVENNLSSEISLKLTQIGLDLSFDNSLENFKMITQKADNNSKFVWIDMEGSPYTSATLNFYKQVRQEYNNAGICLQAYLFRTENDINELLNIQPSIRLVKGAYNESSKVAFEKKSEVDKNYFHLAKILLRQIKSNNIRAAFATHDINLITKIVETASQLDISRDKLEFQMLYGIKQTEQLRLIKEGFRLKILISYGSAWYPWYMRRLAERPANVGFVIKNIFKN